MTNPTVYNIRLYRANFGERWKLFESYQLAARDPHTDAWISAYSHSSENPR